MRIAVGVEYDGTAYAGWQSQATVDSIQTQVERLRACLVHRTLDVAAMQTAAQWLVGEHDFTSFRSAECQSRTPVRRVDSVTVVRDGEFVLIDVTANAFLHHMVRNFAGALMS